MQVHWLACHSSDVPFDDDWLSGRERGTLARLRNTKRRDDWRLGRWTAKNAFALREGLENAPAILASIEISTGPTGVPTLVKGKEPTPYVMSLSHSHDVALCSLAEAGSLLGCDLEWVEARSDAFLAEYISPDEQRQVPTGDCFRRHAVVSALWSAKESVLKALGCGLHVDLLRLGVTLWSLDEEEEWRRLTVSVGAAPSFEGWWRIENGFAWTLVAFPQSPAPLALHERSLD